MCIYHIYIFQTKDEKKQLQTLMTYFLVIWEQKALAFWLSFGFSRLGGVNGVYCTIFGQLIKSMNFDPSTQGSGLNTYLLEDTGSNTSSGEGSGAD